MVALHNILWKPEVAILFWQKPSFETVGKSLSAFVLSMADATVIRGHKFATFEGVANVEQFCKAG